MKLNEIVDQIFDIATELEYNRISYSHPLLVLTQKNPRPANLLSSIAAPLQRDLANDIPIDNGTITVALKQLKKIAKEYRIQELREPIRNLESYLVDLG